MGELMHAARTGRTAETTHATADAAKVRAAAGVPQVSHARRTVQPKLAVGAANDAFEQEADRTADAVMSSRETAAIGGNLATSLSRWVRRALGKTEPPARKDDDDKKKLVQKDGIGPGASTVPEHVESSIDRMSTGGTALSPTLRAVFEPRFGFDFSDVRVHAGSDAAHAASALGARAFTVGDHVFFGAGEYQPTSAQGQRLIAHELTHTIQQKPGAARAARAIAPRLAAPKRVQRLFEDVVASIRNKVRDYIVKDFPPWDLITLIIGWDPIQEKAVKGATRDWIRAAMKLAPDGEALFERLDKEGKIDSVAKWWDAQVAKLDLTYAGIVALVKKGWEALSAGDVFDPFGAYNKKLKPLFEPVVKRVWDFIKEVGGKILAVVKDLVLGQIGEWAKKQKGYTLLTIVLGKDPVTGEEVKPTLKGVIFAVLDLIEGGDKIKENLEKSKTIEKAAEWFKAEVKKLDLTFEGIKQLFRQAWDAFKVADLLNPKLLFDKMAAIFGPPVLRLVAFLVAVGKKVLELIFEGAMLLAGPIGQQIAGIFKKIGDTFNKIVADPVAFVGHLVDAVKKGIQQFAKNIWDHLKTGLIGWLVGTLEGAGLVLPKVWDLKGILDLVLQILGISYAKIRAKLVKVLGEKTVGMLERAFEFIKTLVTEGPVAAWKQIVEAIGGLWDLVIGGIKDWAVTKIVTAAITKLATMFNPAGAVIQAIIATYNTVAFFIERIKQILAFVEAVVDSIANIAAGKIAQAANWVETAMARTIPVILGFLARLIGLGNVSDAVKKVITAIQAKVDKGIDFVIDFVVKKAKSLFGAGKADEVAPGKAAGPGAVPDIAIEGEEPHTLSVKEQGGALVVVIHSAEAQIGAFLDEAQKKYEKNKRKVKLIGECRQKLTAVETRIKAVKATSDEVSRKKAESSLIDAEKALAAAIKRLLAGADMDKLKEKYKLEGIVKTYATLPKPTYDKLTPDHQPQAALITLIANVKSDGRKLFGGLGIQGIAANRAALGVAINLHEQRHYKTRTYGTPVTSATENKILGFAASKDSDDVKRRKIVGVAKDELKSDLKEIRNVVKKPEGALWSDIDDVLKGDEDAKEDAKAIKEEVAARIKAGEDEIELQDFNRWTA